MKTMTFLGRVTKQGSILKLYIPKMVQRYIGIIPGDELELRIIAVRSQPRTETVPTIKVRSRRAK
jgi:bifunctional DNA-binding transcriptional regulator/antitoxin component of YhaV-PrlF toxin-antitoxin module